MNIRILEQAKEDLQQGFLFYESQESGLGDYFFECLDSDIESLRTFAGVHPLVHDYHRCLSKRFPFAIYYEIEGDTAFVHAVLDCRQAPGKIRRRLRPGR
jgi:hypothetical protein